MTDTDWIKLRLRDGATFVKNGVTISVDEAVEAALEDYASKVAAARKYYALADLLEVELSDMEADDEKEGDYSAGKKSSTLQDRIERLRDQGDAIQAGGSPTSDGGIRVIDATFGEYCVDENSSL
jgi:hypothetical protein